MTDPEACQQLLMQLLPRKPFTAHELKRALGEEHWEDYEGRLERVKEWREEAMIASYELRDYVRMLRIADLHDAQPNQISGHMRKRRLRWTSPSTKYERALEHLSKRIEENGSLANHLDRAFSPYSWDNSTDIGPDKDGVPRLWYTENALPQSEQRKIKTIRELRREALERAIEALSAPPAASKKRHLKRFRLRKLRKSR